MKASATTIAGGAAVGGGLWYSSQAVLAAHAEGWNADDPEAVQTNDGEIDDVVLTAGTTVSVDYENLAGDDQEARIRIQARPAPENPFTDDPTWRSITEGRVTLPGTQGHEDFTIEDWDDDGQASFIDDHEDLEREHFEPDEEGQTKETTIELRLRVRIQDGPDESLEAAPDDTEFTTTVTWNESTMEAGGDGQVDVKV